MAYLVGSNDEYEALKPEFLKAGKLVSEDLVSVYKVGIFKPKKDLVIEGQRIKAFELLCFQESKEIKPGVDHVEFVVKDGFEEVLKKYPALAWNTKAMKRDIYPKLTIDDLSGVKFEEEAILESALKK